MTSLRLKFLGMIALAAIAACGRAHRAAAPVGDDAGASGESNAGGSGGSSGGVSGNGGKGGAMVSDAGGGASGSGGGANAIDTVRELNDARWAAVCRGLFECTLMEGDGVAGFRAAFGDEARCREIFQQSVVGNFGVADLVEAVAQGRVVLLPDQVSACLEATAACDYWSNPQPAVAACRRVFEGTQGIGEACFRGEECTSGRCAVTDACPGTCQPLAAPNEACATDDDCDASTGDAYCDLEVCKVDPRLPPVGEGEECWEVSEVGDRQPCAAGLWCDGDGIDFTSGTEPGDEYLRGTCRSTPIAAGEACAGDEDVCEPGYACQDVSCEPVLVAHEIGAPCGTDVGFCDPFERLECVDGFCESSSDGLEGSPCQFFDASAYRSCEPGLVCVVTRIDDPLTSETPRACLLPRATGESCQRDHECASETCGSDNLCAERFCANAQLQF